MAIGRAHGMIEPDAQDSSALFRLIAGEQTVSEIEEAGHRRSVLNRQSAE